MYEFVLPPYWVEEVFTTKALTVDWGLELLGIPNLWRMTRGDGIKVAVLDTGAALNHPDLRDAILDAKDFTNSRSGPSDVVGHGTGVCGIIAARENSSGAIGVAPLSKLLVAKIIDDSGVGTPDPFMAALRWAVDNGAHIISMSLGCSNDYPPLHAVIDELSSGTVLVAAAGNEGPALDTVNYPARYDGVIAVGAIDRRREVAKFSSRGKQVDIVAPGDNIVTTYPPKGLARMSGTSMAAPLVSGIIALCTAKMGRQSSKNVLQMLKSSAIDVDKPGYDENAGWGLINPEALLSVVVPKSIDTDVFTLSYADLTKSGKKKLSDYLSKKTAGGEIQARVVL